MKKTKKAKTKRTKKTTVKGPSLREMVASSLSHIKELAKNVTISEPVRVAEPEVKGMRAKLLEELETALKAVPDGAQGIGMSVIIENNEVKTVRYSNKKEALALLDRAKKNEISLVF